VSNPDEEQSSSQVYSAEGTDTQVPNEGLEYLHPTLRESFVALPPSGIRLTQSQLNAVFAGDLRVLRDLARLVYKSSEDTSE
jgi:hypothetical protein